MLRASPADVLQACSVPAVLGTRDETVAVHERTRWLRRPTTRTRTTTDWTVDGVGLKVLLGEPDDTECDRVGTEHRLDPTGELHLRALLGEPVPAALTMRTGEVVVLSTCGGECCPAYSARVEVGPDTVTWRDLAYRDWWGGIQEEPVLTLVFDRASYERTVRSEIEAVVRAAVR